MPNSLDKFMFEKILQGQRVGGFFSKVKIDPQEEKESCVFRLGDLDPDQFYEKREKSHHERAIYRKAILKGEVSRSFRLDGKLQKVVEMAKKRLIRSPEGKQFFKKIVNDMNLRADPEDSDD